MFLAFADVPGVLRRGRAGLDSGRPAEGADRGPDRLRHAPDLRRPRAPPPLRHHPSRSQSRSALDV